MSTCKCKNNQTDNLKELDEILETYGKKKGYLITYFTKSSRCLWLYINRYYE